MKYTKILGLLAVAAAALMAFAGTASAVQLTSPQGTTYTSTIKATSTNTELHGTWTTVKCKHSEVVGKVEFHGGTTTGGRIAALNFSSCENGEVTSIKDAGNLAINSKGEVFSSGAEVKVHTSVGECVFKTENTKIGTFTSSPNSTTSATLNINSASIPRKTGSIFCGTSGTWTGSYSVTTPVPLFLD